METNSTNSPCPSCGATHRRASRDALRCYRTPGDTARELAEAIRLQDDES